MIVCTILQYLTRLFVLSAAARSLPQLSARTPQANEAGRSSLSRCNRSRTTMYSCSSLTASSAELSARISRSIGAVWPGEGGGQDFGRKGSSVGSGFTIVFHIHDTVDVETAMVEERPTRSAPLHGSHIVDLEGEPSPSSI